VKKYIAIAFIALIIVFGVVSPVVAEEKRIFLSVGGGLFQPKLDASDYNKGTNYTLSTFFWPTDSILGAGIDVNRNKIDFQQTIIGNTLTSEIETTSLEFLIYIQPNTWKIQPYIGIGMGTYINTVTNKWGNSTVFDDGNQSGFGFVTKGGFRVFIGNTFFIGAYGKYFTNAHAVKYTTTSGDKITLNYNIGGTVVNAEIGMRF
jgi:hypothetical protein